MKSTFPVSLGARITGVDDKTYSSTGEAFSAILLPNSESNATKKLQADDVSLAYEVGQLPNLDQPRPEQPHRFLVLTTRSISLCATVFEEVPRVYFRKSRGEGRAR